MKPSLVLLFVILLFDIGSLGAQSTTTLTVATCTGAQVTPPVSTAGTGKGWLSFGFLTDQYPPFSTTYWVTGKIQFTSMSGPILAVSAYKGNTLVTTFTQSAADTFTYSSALKNDRTIYDGLMGACLVATTAAHPNGEVRGCMYLTITPHPFGRSCASGGQNLSIQSPTMWPGTTFEINWRPSSTVFLVIGNSANAFGSWSLPLDLTSLGMTGCWLNVNDLGFGLAATTSGSGWALIPVQIPLTFLPAIPLYAQAFVAYPGANPLGLASTNGLAFALN